MDLMNDEYTIDLSDDEIAALNPFLGEAEPVVEKIAKSEPVAPRAEPEPKRVDLDQTDLLKRVRDAEERAATERAKRLSAEKLAHERGTTVAVTSVRAAEGEYTAVANALARTDSHIETLVAQKQAALEAGDYAAEGKISLQLAKAVAQQAQLTDGKAQLEDRVKTARTQAETAIKTQSPAQDTADPFENFLAGQHPRAQSWFRDHPDFAPTSSKKNFSRALAAHHDALANDISEGSDDYYKHLERKLGLAKEDDVTDDDDEVVTEKVAAPAKKAPKADKPARVAAPVSRDGGVVQRTADGKFQYRLSADEAKAADELGIDRLRYARQLAKLQAGERDPNYTGPRLNMTE